MDSEQVQSVCCTFRSLPLSLHSRLRHRLARPSLARPHRNLPLHLSGPRCRRLRRGLRLCKLRSYAPDAHHVQQPQILALPRLLRHERLRGLVELAVLSQELGGKTFEENEDFKDAAERERWGVRK